MTSNDDSPIRRILVERPAKSDAPSRHWRTFVSLSTIILDFATVFAVVLAVSFVYHNIAYGHSGRPGATLELAFALSTVFVFTNLMQKRYRLQRYLTKKGQLVEAFNAWNVTVIGFVSIGFMTRMIENYSRAVVVFSYFLGVCLVPLMRHLVVHLISRASKTGIITAQRVFVIGREQDILSFAQRHQPWNSGLVVQQMILLDEPLQADARHKDLPALDEKLNEAVADARLLKPDAIFIALPWSERAYIERCIEAFMTVPVSINLAPEEVMDRFEKLKIKDMGSFYSLELLARPLTSPEIFAKRALDFIGATIGCILLMPLFLIVAILIKLDSPGPVLFLQRRYGFNQEEFRIFKFRTMCTLDDGSVIAQAKKDDPRVTRVGRWLRRCNIDELPQLFNVLLGHMSLVGPRPHALAHDREFEQRIALYARRHNVKPGITGWAQVNGLRGLTDTDEKMERRVRYDLWYIDNWTIWLDLVIMFRTVFSRTSYRNAN